MIFKITLQWRFPPSKTDLCYLNCSTFLHPNIRWYIRAVKGSSEYSFTCFSYCQKFCLSYFCFQVSSYPNPFQQLVFCPHVTCQPQDRKDCYCTELATNPLTRLCILIEVDSHMYAISTWCIHTQYPLDAFILNHPTLHTLDEHTLYINIASTHQSHSFCSQLTIQ